MPARDRVAADDERDLLGVARQVHGGLARGVRAARDVHLTVGHHRCLRPGAAVVHARAVERLELGDAEALVLGAGGEQHRGGGTAPPSDRSTERPSSSARNMVTNCMNENWAPKTHACWCADWARRRPLTPRGNPR